LKLDEVKILMNVNEALIYYLTQENVINQLSFTPICKMGLILLTFIKRITPKDILQINSTHRC
jgi:hypothetical protein